MDQQVLQLRDAVWQKRISEALCSGLTKREWCRQNGISEKAFYYHQHKARKMALSVAEGQGNPDLIKDQRPATFVELPFVANDDSEDKTGNAFVAGTPEMLISVNGYRLFVFGTVQEQTLSVVMKVLKNA